jgi:DNA-binding response OmpR family regulator
MVYLVDDDPDDREIIREALIENSYKGPVLPFENGKMLLNQLANPGTDAKPDVVILDLNMPLLSGFEVLEELRKHQSFNKIPVIVLTASSKKEDEIRSFELGCNFFMTKPSKISEYLILTAAVKKFISAA